MKKIILIGSMIIMGNAFAEVPVVDSYNVTTDTTTSSAYLAQIPGYLAQMKTAMNAAQQVQALQGLQSVQGAGSQLCALCNAQDLAKIQNYIGQVNGDLCSQFSSALSNITGAQQSITSLQGIATQLASNPKAAALALQQASIATQSATQNTMAQMQMLQAQAVQKQLAQDRYNQALVSSTTNVQSGL